MGSAVAWLKPLTAVLVLCVPLLVAGVAPESRSDSPREGELVKIFSIIALILSTILVLAWPLCLFITPFLFDHATTDETKIGAFLIAFLGYPAGWIIALISLPLRRLVKSPKKWWESPTPYLFLIPFAHLGVAFVMVAVGFLGR